MIIAISGATGFVGSHLKAAFEVRRWTVVPLGRDAFRSPDLLRRKLTGADVVIHLAGAPIAARWTEDYKKEIRASRVATTHMLVSALGALESRPKLFISTSAVGIYPANVPCDESTSPLAGDFLGLVAQDWEREASRTRELNVRTVIFRFGVVLGTDGGALQKMLIPFRLGLGGIIGDGKQTFSWVHINDLVSAFLFVIEHEALGGVFNLTSPNPTTNAGLTKALGAALHRPAFVPVPTFVLRLQLGEGADVLLKGQHVLPRRLLETGFKFRYPRIEEALMDLVGSS
ncbi:MAG TPA: TIGR01777 family oxidoreductase [Dissulfurispiraceae bacterium]|nr:TIGR01777 family oxidoreductase [Dissulfurispiraceae bacterium]